MTKRVPSAPPQIPGFEHVSLVGSGGFADVFLYEQKRPRRRVAIKVLLHEWSDPAQRSAFEGEADLMATLSTHPSIVTIYEADVAPDGRPYLAMEYCSRASLGTRYRSERLGVAESLRVIVQIAGAVETAHRAGILHRDIKPANILGTDYGHPVLTDFGISSTVDDVVRAEGLSIPWSPPESFEDPPRASRATDVWALGATLYSFLAGRSPFEVPGGSNGSAELVQRIVAQPLAPTGRSDVPASLELVLATSMAKNPNARYPSVLELARSLQQVQIELGHAVTPIDILEDTGVVQDAVVMGGGSDDDDEGGTRLRGVTSIDPSGGPAPAARRPAPAAPSPTFGPGAPQQPVARAVPPMFVAAPTPARVPVPEHTARVSEVNPAPQFASSTPLAMVAAPTGLQMPSEDTVLRPDEQYRDHSAGRPSEQPAVPASTGASTGKVLAIVFGSLAAFVVVVLAIVVGLQGGGSGGADPQATKASVNQDDGGGSQGDGGSAQDNLDSLVPSVTGLVGIQYDDLNTVDFTWDMPKHYQDGDQFMWQLIDPRQDDPPWHKTSDPGVSMPITQDPMCINVVLLRDGKQSAQPTHACAKKDD